MLITFVHYICTLHCALTLIQSKMASWMTSLISMGKTALERMAAPADPNQVRLVNKTELASMPTMDE